MHALIIDDDKNSLNVLSQMLQFEGIESSTVSDPLRVGDALSRLPAVDLVFLDLEMPVSNGFRVFDQLRADPRFEHVPIVACTVHSSEMSHTRSLGFDSFIGKPIDADRFPEQLRQILSGSQVWQM